MECGFKSRRPHQQQLGHKIQSKVENVLSIFPYREVVTSKFSFRSFFRRERHRVRRDIFVLGVLILSVLLLIWNGSSFFGTIGKLSTGFGIDHKLSVTALTLNVTYCRSASAAASSTSRPSFSSR